LPLLSSTFQFGRGIVEQFFSGFSAEKKENPKLRRRDGNPLSIGSKRGLCHHEKIFDFIIVSFAGQSDAMAYEQYCCSEPQDGCRGQN